MLAGGGATYSRDLYLPYERHGYVEETYRAFSYSPLRTGTLPLMTDHLGS